MQESINQNQDIASTLYNLCVCFLVLVQKFGAESGISTFLMNFKNSLISKKGEVAKFKIAYYIFNNIQL